MYDGPVGAYHPGGLRSAYSLWGTLYMIMLHCGFLLAGMGLWAAITILIVLWLDK